MFFYKGIQLIQCLNQLQIKMLKATLYFDQLYLHFVGDMTLVYRNSQEKLDIK